MKKLLYAASNYEQDTKDETIEQLRRLVSSSIMILHAYPLPRNIDSSVHKSIHPIPKIRDAVSYADATDARAQDVIHEISRIPRIYRAIEVILI